MAARITRMAKRRLGELLQVEGLVTEEQVRNARVEQRKSNLFLSEALVKMGLVTEEAIASTIAQQFNLPYLGVDQYKIGEEMLDLFPEAILYEYQFLPLEKMGDVLIIAGAGLMNHDMLDELERLSGCKICQYVGTWVDIRNAIERLFKDHKKEDSNALTDLGSMLLNESDIQEAVRAPRTIPGVEVSGAQGDSEASLADDIAATVAALTGGNTTDVLQEALAAVEGPSSSGPPSMDIPAPPPPPPPRLSSEKKDDLAALFEEAQPASAAPAPQIRDRNPTPLPAPGGKMSAFAAGSARAPKAQNDHSEDLEDRAPSKEKETSVKGNVLGFLKKK